MEQDSLSTVPSGPRVEKEERPLSVERHVAGDRFQTLTGIKAQAAASVESHSVDDFEFEFQDHVGLPGATMVNLRRPAPAPDSPAQRPGPAKRGYAAWLGSVLKRRVPPAATSVPSAQQDVTI